MNRPFWRSQRQQFAADNTTALGESDFLANLQHLIPPRSLQRRRDELRANISFGERAFIEGHGGGLLRNSAIK